MTELVEFLKNQLDNHYEKPIQPTRKLQITKMGDNVFRFYFSQVIFITVDGKKGTFTVHELNDSLSEKSWGLDNCDIDSLVLKHLNEKFNYNHWLDEKLSSLISFKTRQPEELTTADPKWSYFLKRINKQASHFEVKELEALSNKTFNSISCLFDDRQSLLTRDIINNLFQTYLSLVTSNKFYLMVEDKKYKDESIVYLIEKPNLTSTDCLTDKLLCLAIHLEGGN